MDRLIRLALPQLRRATGVESAIGGPVSRGGRRLVITSLDTMLTPVFLGQVFSPGMGVNGKALQLGRPVAVDNYLASTRITHPFDAKVRQEHLQSIFAVPVHAGGHIQAVLSGGLRSGEPLGDRVLDAAVSVAAALGREIAIEQEMTRRLQAIEQHRQRTEWRGLTADESREIYDELRSIASATGDSLLSGRLRVVCDRMALAVEPPATHGPYLTNRERAVLVEVALGRTNQEIADRLAIMPTTVKTYLQNTMRKLGTRNRVETIQAARRAGVLA
ncbi:LuxR C-terminal-related transcriptional regulator [Geodermatophilus sp. SYSU D00691]